MAIDYNSGINSIDVGAHDITYSGNQGPKSPEQKEMMAFDDTPRFELQPLELLLDEFRQDNNGNDPTSIDDLRRFFYNKYGPEGIAKLEQAIQQAEQQAQMQEGREGIQMASAADPMLQDEYDKYVFEMEEQGLQPMSLEEFRQQAVAGMATGGRVRYQGGGRWDDPGMSPGTRQDYSPGQGHRDDPRGGEGPPSILNPPKIPTVLLQKGEEGYDAKANIDLLKKLKIYQTLAEADASNIPPSMRGGAEDALWTPTRQSPVTTGGVPGGGDPEMYLADDIDCLLYTSDAADE